MRTFLHITLIALLFTACEKDDFAGGKQQNGEPVTVSLNIGKQTTRGLKAANEMEPEKENLIYDIWLLQYNSLGQLAAATGVDKRQHLRVGEEGVTLISDLQVTLQASEASTIFLIANLGDSPLENNAQWPEDLESFKMLSIPIDYLSVPSGDDKDGHVNKIGLFGQYTGPVANGMDINFSLNRLITRVKLNITPSSEMSDPVVIKLENVRSRINIYPTPTPFQSKGNTEEEIRADRAANFTTFSKTLPGLSVGGTILYFYMGENINPSPDNATKLSVTNNGKVYTALLGAEKPEASEPSTRNLSLERNSKYDFDINLKVMHLVQEDIVRDHWSATGGQGVNNAENIINNSQDSEQTFIWKSSLGTWIKIDTKKETKFNRIRLLQNYSSANTKIANISLYGSHDNSSFELIDSFEIPYSNSEQSFELSRTVEYRYLRIKFNRWYIAETNGNVYISQFNLSYDRWEY